MKRTIGWSGISCLLIGALSSCGGTGKDAATAPKAPPPVPVFVAEVQKGAAVYYDQYPATVVALNEVQVRPQVTGYITGIFFKDGQHVRKGEKLYAIDQQQYRAGYEQALANVNVAKANLAKAQQEALIQESGMAHSIVHSTQFFEFLESIADFSTDGGRIPLTHAFVQPIAADDIADAVVDAALSGPTNAIVEHAGPEVFRLDELVEQQLRSRRDPREVEVDPLGRYFGAQLAEKDRKGLTLTVLTALKDCATQLGKGQVDAVSTDCWPAA